MGRAAAWVLWGGLGMLPVACALAQSVPGASQIESARQRPPAPLPPLPKFDLRLQTPEKAPVQRAIDELVFEVKKVRITGATAYPVSELEALFRPLLGKQVTLSALQTLTDQIEARYQADRFFLSRAFIPPQRVRDGVVEIRIVEGRIGAVFVEGGSSAYRAKVEALLADIPKEKPIRLPTLEQAVLMADELPGVTATAVLRAGATAGESELVLVLSELSNSVITSTNNAASNTTGPWTLSAMTVVNNPFGHNSQVLLGANFTPDVKTSHSLFARYTGALLSAGTTWSVGAVASKSAPGGTLAVLENENENVSVGPRLRHAILKSRHSALYLDLGLSINRARSSYFGIVTSEDRSSVAEATLSWQSVQPGAITQSSLSLSRGTGLFDAMGREASLASVADFEPRFQKWVYSVTRTQALPGNVSVLFNTVTQYTRHVLLAGEMASFGGLGIGRGYDSGAISGDQGTGGLLELRHDSVWNGVRLQPYVFLDAAKTRYLSTNTSQRLKSSGAGLRFYAGGSQFDLAVARALTPLNSTDPKANPRLLFNGSTRF